MLTYEEYQTILPHKPISEDEFNSNRFEALNVIDYLTRDFLHFKDFDNLPTYLQTKLRHALALQISYFVEKGANTASAISDTPMSVTVGRTSISKDRADQKTADGYSDIHIPVEVVTVLQPTGLLYRGVGC